MDFYSWVMNIMWMTPDWLIVIAILFGPLLWAHIGRTVSDVNPKRWQRINKIVLVLWLLLLIYGTLLSRWNIDLTGVEWSLTPLHKLHWYNINSIYLNVAIFEPIGALLSTSLRGSKSSMSRLIVTLLIGLSLSSAIEILQQILVLGVFQIDDVIWNTTGCFIGVSSVVLECRIHGKKHCKLSC